MPHLVLSLLGQVNMTLDARPINGFESDKVRALFIYLATHANRPFRREHLSALLWSDHNEKSAQQNLRKALHRLRQAIGQTETSRSGDAEFLIITPQTIAFNSASDYEIDVNTFEALLAQTRNHTHRRLDTCRVCAEHMSEAVALYCGDFLAGFALKDSPEFDQWMTAQRERLRLSLLDALAVLADYYEQRGNLSAAQACARRQIAMEPWLESAHRQLMRVLALDGNRAAALAQYGVCKEILLRELGVEPEPQTTVVYEQIKQHKFAHTNGHDEGETAWLVHGRIVLRNFPARLTPFVGRERELRHIGELLHDPQCRLLTLVGTGGSGKTRLALEAAEAEAVTFEDGACFVSLAALSSAEQIPSAIVSALGLTPQLAHPPKKQVLHHLQAREMLLVLDNLEHLLESAEASAAAFVSELIQACPRVVVLTTSRERLRLYGEHEVVVLPLPTPPALTGEDDAAVLLQYPSVELFVQRARAAGAQLDLDQPNGADVRAIGEICTRLDGLPLAIELAAVRSNLLSPRELLAQLQSRLAFLNTGPRDLPVRLQTLFRAIAWSYALLTRPEQLLFRRLAVFAGGFTVGAVEAVCNADGAFGAQTLEHLAALADKSLINKDLSAKSADEGAEAAHNLRFSMLETLREFALEQLLASNDLVATRHQHVRYYCALIEANDKVIHQQPLRRLMARFDREHANLRAALAWAYESQQFDYGLRLVAAMTRFWRRGGHIHEGQDWAKRMLQGDHAASPSAQASLDARAAALLGAAEMERITGRQSEAQTLAAASLELNRRLNNNVGAAYSLAILGALAHYARARDQATQLLVEAEALFRAAGERVGLGYALLWLGDIRLRMHDIPWAEACFAEALAIFRAVDDPVYLSWALGGLGDIARMQGNFGQARAALREALELHLAVANQYGTPFPIEALAIVATAQHHTVRAAILWGIAEHLRQISDMPVPASYQMDYDQHLQAVRDQLGLAAFDLHKATGHAMSFSRAMEYVLRLEPDVDEWAGDAAG